MKKILIIISLLFSVVALAQVEKAIPARPNPPKLVNDFTGTLTPQQVEALENKLVAYDDSTSSQIAVVIVPTTGSYSVEDFALAILRGWGVGGKDNSNGIVILVAKNDRKVRIEVGYGLEGSVPDLTARSIIDNYITPNFREGNYYRGLDQAIDAIFRAAAGEYKAPAGARKNKSKGPGIGSLIILFIIIMIISGMGGRGGGGVVSRKGYRDFGAGWILGSLLGGMGRGSGGGWSGGSSGGGGFGGFGGGGGGGGGASGSW